MIHSFQNFVQSNALFDKEEKLLLAFSGGADSVALFYLLKDSGYSFSVAHVNYSLRGEESNEDAAFVKDLCEEYKVPCFIKVIPGNHWQKGMNIQSEARDIRYAFFNKLKKEHGFTNVLTAHHKDDNVETILMNLTRGTGIKGLKGIEVKKEGIIRPLLFAERSEIESFLNEHEYSWRTDSSNSSTKYKRNRFRSEIIPLLKKENPSLIAAFDRLIENVTYVDEVFEEAYSKFKEKHIRGENNQIKINKSEIILLKRFLFEFLKDFNFNRDQVADLLAALNNVGKNFESNSHSLFVDREDLVLVEKEESEINELEIVENASALLHPIMLRFFTIDRLIKGRGNDLGQFDKGKLTFPLKLRQWKEGDKIQPLGMKGTKKISDVLIDKKISIADKPSVLVLESDGEVIWVPGLMTSEKVKVDDSTSDIWCAELQKEA